jgi:hypothetical protein
MLRKVPQYMTADSDSLIVGVRPYELFCFFTILMQSYVSHSSSSTKFLEAGVLLINIMPYFLGDVNMTFAPKYGGRFISNCEITLGDVSL